MNKQFDVFVKMKITEMSKTIHDMTYTYINPETKKPTDVPAKHYQDIWKQPVEVMVEEQVKKQFLNIMFTVEKLKGRGTTSVLSIIIVNGYW